MFSYSLWNTDGRNRMTTIEGILLMALSQNLTKKPTIMNLN